MSNAITMFNYLGCVQCHKSLQLPFEIKVLPFTNQPSRLVGSCHGLVCLLVAATVYIVCNFAIHKYSELPLPHQSQVAFCAFGFESFESDYKILSGQQKVSDFLVEIFPTKLNSWKSLLVDTPLSLPSTESYVWVDDFLYWTTRHPQSAGSVIHISLYMKLRLKSSKTTRFDGF